jgi:transposase
MIGVPRGVTVYAYAEPCDMRKSFDTLSAVVSNAMRLDLLTGDLFLFVSKARKRATVLYFDGTGMCLFAKRLDQGKFVALWKRHHTGKELTLTLSELGLFIEGATALRAPLSPPLIRTADLRMEKES